MAAGKENTGIQIALIIFVILTIVLSVTTYLFYKETEEQNSKVTAAAVSVAAKVKEIEAVKKDVALLKTLAGKKAADDDSVESIMEVYKEDQRKYGITFKESDPQDPALRNYPVMLRTAFVAYQKLQDDIDQQTKQIAELGLKHQAELASLDEIKTKTEGEFKAQAAKIREIHTSIADNQARHEAKIAASQQTNRNLQNEAQNIQGEKDKVERDLTGQLASKVDDLKKATKALEDTRTIDLSKPDGEVIFINQANGTAYIDLGYVDGLRKQMTFNVFDRGVTNALKATKKGSIEVVRVDDEHFAVAKITDDDSTNPIVKGDVISSEVFHPGRPERFALAGFLDVDGDARSDLDLMIMLVRRNGAEVDAYVDVEGNRTGTMSPSTKYLVIGEQPNENSKPKVLNSYNRILTEADKNGVKTMSLTDFLDYMGFQGRERSVGLGRNADPEDFKPGAKDRSTPFRRRRPGSAY